MLRISVPCAVWVEKVSGGRQSTLHLAGDYAVDILRCFGVDVRNDDPDIHPIRFL